MYIFRCGLSWVTRAKVLDKSIANNYGSPFNGSRAIWP